MKRKEEEEGKSKIDVPQECKEEEMLGVGATSDEQLCEMST